MIFSPNLIAAGDAAPSSEGFVRNASNSNPHLRAGSLDLQMLAGFATGPPTSMPMPWACRGSQSRSFEFPAPGSGLDASCSPLCQQETALSSVLFKALDSQSRGFVRAGDFSREVHSLATTNPRFQDVARGLLARLARSPDQLMSSNDFISLITTPRRARSSVPQLQHPDDALLCSLLQHLISSIHSTHPALTPTSTPRNSLDLPAPHRMRPCLTPSYQPTLRPAPQLPQNVVNSSAFYLPATLPPLATPRSSIDMPPTPPTSFTPLLRGPHSSDDSMSSPTSSPPASKRCSFDADAAPDGPHHPLPTPTYARLSAAKMRLHHLIDLEVPSHNHRHTSSQCSTNSQVSSHDHTHPYSHTQQPASHPAPYPSLRAPSPACSTQSTTSTSSAFSCSSFSSLSTSTSAHLPSPRLRPPPASSLPHLAYVQDAHEPSCSMLTDRLRTEEGWGSMEGMLFAGNLAPGVSNASGFSMMDCHTIFESPLVQALLDNTPHYDFH